jgi:ketopantoate reductase
MKALIIGAGAVGQVLGAYLERGGAQVSYLTRPQHAESLSRGFVVRPLGRAVIEVPHPDVVGGRGGGDGVQLSSNPPSASDGMHRSTGLLDNWTPSPPPDCVFLCMSSTALRRGSWLDELAPTWGGATVVGIQPGLDDLRFVSERVGAHRVVWGMFAFMSWASGDGVSFYRPPLGALPLTGDRERVQPIVETLRRGGLPARRHPDVVSALAFGGALLDLHMVALECAGFDFASLRGDRELVADMHRAMREALLVTSALRGRRAPLGLRLVRPWLTRLALRLLPRLVPFDVELYLQRHYTKVADQTIAGLRHYLSLAARASLPHHALERMLARLESTRAEGGAHARTVSVVAPQAAAPSNARDRPRA